jgi:hypothetical protein
LVYFYQEIAFCHLKEQNYEKTIENCLKTIELDPSSVFSQRTLCIASEACGITSQKQEEIIFSYLIRTVRKQDSIEKYYQSCISKYAGVVWYQFFYANYLVTNAATKTEPMISSLFERCKQLYTEALKLDENK